MSHAPSDHLVEDRRGCAARGKSLALVTGEGCGLGALRPNGLTRDDGLGLLASDLRLARFAMLRIGGKQ